MGQEEKDENQEEERAAADLRATTDLRATAVKAFESLSGVEFTDAQRAEAAEAVLRCEYRGLLHGMPWLSGLSEQGT